MPPRFTKHFHLPLLFDFSVIKKKGKQEMLVVELQTMRSFLYHQLNAQKNGRKEKIVIIANISSISAQFCAIWWDLQDAFYVEHKLFPNRESDSLCQIFKCIDRVCNTFNRVGCAGISILQFSQYFNRVNKTAELFTRSQGARLLVIGSARGLGQDILKFQGPFITFYEKILIFIKTYW